MLYTEKTKRKHVVVKTPWYSLTRQDVWIAKQHSNWRRCNNLAHWLLHNSGKQVCIVRKK